MSSYGTPYLCVVANESPAWRMLTTLDEVELIIPLTSREIKVSLRTTRYGVFSSRAGIAVLDYEILIVKSEFDGDSLDVTINTLKNMI